MGILDILNSFIIFILKFFASLRRIGTEQ